MSRVYIHLIILIFVLLGCDGITHEQEMHEMANPPLELIREPYLQNNFADSVTILWKTTNAAGTGYVKVQSEDGNIRKVRANVERQTVNTLSYAVINNLKANTKYIYKVYNDDQLMSDDSDNYFYSADTSDDRFSFLAMGDIGQPPSWNGHLDETVEQILELEEEPNLILGFGDLVYPEGSSFEADRNFFKPMSDILSHTPFYSVPGNHDHKSDLDKHYKQEWMLPGNEQYYSFDYGNAHFIGLDSGDDYGFTNCINQMAWLEEDLKCAQDKYDWIILFIHHHGITCTYKGDENDVLRIYPLLADYNVDLVLNGHIHKYERLKPLDSLGLVIDQFKDRQFVYPEIKDGFISVTAGAAGRVSHSEPKTDMTACREEKVVEFLEELSFAKVSVDGRVLNFNLISSESGEVLDHFTIDKSL